MPEEFKSLSNIELIVSSLLVLLFILQIIYPWISMRKLIFYKDKQATQTTTPLPPLSVIICAKNEANNLRTFLPKVLEQDYPEFQVVIINDCSDDSSDELLGEMSKKYNHLYFSTIKKDPIYRHGKKLAVMLGIKAAKHEHLIFTDADCYPTSNLWLQSMASQFSNKKSIVLGVSPYEQTAGLLGQVVGYETLSTAMHYISSALRHKTYMGVGRNMAYTKSLFYDNNGFTGHTHILSGDDDLFVNKAATKTNVAIQISDKSKVVSLPETNWSNWWKQKRRHMSTGKYYKAAHKRRFAFEGAINMLFFSFLIAAFVFNIYPLILVGIYCLRFINNSLIRYISCKKLRFERSYFISALWLEIIVPILRSYLLLINLVRPQRFTWR